MIVLSWQRECVIIYTAACNNIGNLECEYVRGCVMCIYVTNIILKNSEFDVTNEKGTNIITLFLLIMIEKRTTLYCFAFSVALTCPPQPLFA